MNILSEYTETDITPFTMAAPTTTRPPLKAITCCAYNGKYWIAGGSHSIQKRVIYSYPEVEEILKYAKIVKAYIKFLTSEIASYNNTEDADPNNNIILAKKNDLISKTIYYKSLVNAAKNKFNSLKTLNYVTKYFRVYTIHSMMISYDGLKWELIEDNPFEWYSYIELNNLPDNISNNTDFGGGCFDIIWNSKLSLWIAIGARTRNTIVTPNGTYATSFTSNISSTSSITINITNQIGTTIATSPDGLNWTSRGTGGSDYGYSQYSTYDVYPKIAWNNTLMLAVAAFRTFPDITGNQFVSGAVTRGNMIVSTDGITWKLKPRSSITNLKLTVRTIAFNGALWVIGGRVYSGLWDTSIQVSTDGTNWTNTVGTGSYEFYHIAWNGSIWMGLAQQDNNYHIFTSSTGYDWLRINTIGANSTTLSDNRLVWDGNYWIITGLTTGDGVTYKTVDGITLIPIDSLNGSRTGPIATNIPLPILGGTLNFPSAFIVGSGSPTSIIRSSDETKWTSTIIDIRSVVYLSKKQGELFSIAWCGTFWIAIGEPLDDYGGKTITTSINGAQWSFPPTYDRDNNRYNPVISNGRDVIWTGNLVVVVGDKIATSSNGTSWITYSSPLTLCNSIVWNGKNTQLTVTRFEESVNGKQLVTVTSTLGISVGEPITIINATEPLNSGTFLITAIGTNTFTWANSIGLEYTEITPVYAYSSLYVVGGDGGIAISIDRLVWRKTKQCPLSIIYDIAWNGDIWIAVGKGEQHSIIVSIDGIRWYTANPETNVFNQCNAIAWNKSLWVAVGTGNNTIATSVDGYNWTGLGKDVFTTYGNMIAFNGTNWIAGGGSYYQLATSSDGINWKGYNLSLNILRAYANKTMTFPYIGTASTAIKTLVDQGVTKINGLITNTPGTVQSVIEFSTDPDTVAAVQAAEAIRISIANATRLSTKTSATKYIYQYIYWSYKTKQIYDYYLTVLPGIKDLNIDYSSISNFAIKLSEIEGLLDYFSDTNTQILSSYSTILNNNIKQAVLDKNLVSIYVIHSEYKSRLVTFYENFRNIFYGMLYEIYTKVNLFVVNDALVDGIGYNANTQKTKSSVLSDWTSTKSTFNSTYTAARTFFGTSITSLTFSDNWTSIESRFGVTQIATILLTSSSDAPNYNTNFSNFNFNSTWSLYLKLLSMYATKINIIDKYYNDTKLELIKWKTINNFDTTTATAFSAPSNGIQTITVNNIENIQSNRVVTITDASNSSNNIDFALVLSVSGNTFTIQNSTGIAATTQTAIVNYSDSVISYTEVDNDFDTVKTSSISSFIGNKSITSTHAFSNWNSSLIDLITSLCKFFLKSSASIYNYSDNLYRLSLRYKYSLNLLEIVRNDAVEYIETRIKFLRDKISFFSIITRQPYSEGSLQTIIHLLKVLDDTVYDTSLYEKLMKLSDAMIIVSRIYPTYAQYIEDIDRTIIVAENDGCRPNQNGWGGSLEAVSTGETGVIHINGRLNNSHISMSPGTQPNAFVKFTMVSEIIRFGKPSSDGMQEVFFSDQTVIASNLDPGKYITIEGATNTSNNITNTIITGFNENKKMFSIYNFAGVEDTGQIAYGTRSTPLLEVSIVRNKNWDYTSNNTPYFLDEHEIIVSPKFINDTKLVSGRFTMIGTTYPSINNVTRSLKSQYIRKDPITTVVPGKTPGLNGWKYFNDVYYAFQRKTDYENIIGRSTGLITVPYSSVASSYENNDNVYVTISGASNTNNNGTFKILKSTGTGISISNPNFVTTHPTRKIYLLYKYLPYNSASYPTSFSFRTIADDSSDTVHGFSVGDIITRIDLGELNAYKVTYVSPIQNYFDIDLETSNYSEQLFRSQVIYYIKRAHTSNDNHGTATIAIPILAFTKPENGLQKIFVPAKFAIKEGSSITITGSKYSANNVTATVIDVFNSMFTISNTNGVFEYGTTTASFTNSFQIYSFMEGGMIDISRNSFQYNQTSYSLHKLTQLSTYKEFKYKSVRDEYGSKIKLEWDYFKNFADVNTISTLKNQLKTFDTLADTLKTDEDLTQTYINSIVTNDVETIESNYLTAATNYLNSLDVQIISNLPSLANTVQITEFGPKSNANLQELTVNNIGTLRAYVHSIRITGSNYSGNNGLKLVTAIIGNKIVIKNSTGTIESRPASAATAVSGTTTLTVISFAPSSNSKQIVTVTSTTGITVGNNITITGSTFSVNNGTYAISAITSNTFTWDNSSGVSENRPMVGEYGDIINFASVGINYLGVEYFLEEFDYQPDTFENLVKTIRTNYDIFLTAKNSPLTAITVNKTIISCTGVSFGYVGNNLYGLQTITVDSIGPIRAGMTVIVSDASSASNNGMHKVMYTSGNTFTVNMEGGVAASNAANNVGNVSYVSFDVALSAAEESVNIINKIQKSWPFRWLLLYVQVYNKTYDNAEALVSRVEKNVKRWLKMKNNAMNSPPYGIGKLSTGEGSEFIVSIPPTNTNYWKVLPYRKFTLVNESEPRYPILNNGQVFTVSPYNPATVNAFNDESEYQVDDVVSYSGSVYVCIKDNADYTKSGFKGVLPSNLERWKQIKYPEVLDGFQNVQEGDPENFPPFNPANYDPYTPVAKYKIGSTVSIPGDVHVYRCINDFFSNQKVKNIPPSDNSFYWKRRIYPYVKFNGEKVEADPSKFEPIIPKAGDLTVTSFAVSSNGTQVVSVTSTTGLTVGQSITIKGPVNAANKGTYAITAIGTNTFTWANTSGVSETQFTYKTPLYDSTKLYTKGDTVLHNGVHYYIGRVDDGQFWKDIPPPGGFTSRLVIGFSEVENGVQKVYLQHSTDGLTVGSYVRLSTGIEHVLPANRAPFVITSINSNPPWVTRATTSGSYQYNDPYGSNPVTIYASFSVTANSIDFYLAGGRWTSFTYPLVYDTDNRIREIGSAGFTPLDLVFYADYSSETTYYEGGEVVKYNGGLYEANIKTGNIIGVNVTNTVYWQKLRYQVVQYDGDWVEFSPNLIPPLDANDFSEYSASQIYLEDDIVKYNGLIYKCINDDPYGFKIKKIFPTDKTYWKKVNYPMALVDGKFIEADPTNALFKKLDELDFHEYENNWLYYQGDIASYNGIVYECINVRPSNVNYPNSISGKSPLTTTGYWEQVSTSVLDYINITYYKPNNIFPWNPVTNKKYNAGTIVLWKGFLYKSQKEISYKLVIDLNSNSDVELLKSYNPSLNYTLWRKIDADWPEAIPKAYSDTQTYYIGAVVMINDFNEDENILAGITSPFRIRIFSCKSLNITRPIQYKYSRYTLSDELDTDGFNKTIAVQGTHTSYGVPRYGTSYVDPFGRLSYFAADLKRRVTHNILFPYLHAKSNANNAKNVLMSYSSTENGLSVFLIGYTGFDLNAAIELVKLSDFEGFNITDPWGLKPQEFVDERHYDNFVNRMDRAIQSFNETEPLSISQVQYHVYANLIDYMRNLKKDIITFQSNKNDKKTQYFNLPGIQKQISDNPYPFMNVVALARNPPVRCFTDLGVGDEEEIRYDVRSGRSHQDVLDQYYERKAVVEENDSNMNKTLCLIKWLVNYDIYFHYKPFSTEAGTEFHLPIDYYRTSKKALNRVVDFYIDSSKYIHIGLFIIDGFEHQYFGLGGKYGYFTNAEDDDSVAGLINSAMKESLKPPEYTLPGSQAQRDLLVLTYESKNPFVNALSIVAKALVGICAAAFQSGDMLSGMTGAIQFVGNWALTGKPDGEITENTPGGAEFLRISNSLPSITWPQFNERATSIIAVKQQVAAYKQNKARLQRAGGTTEIPADLESKLPEFLTTLGAILLFYDICIDELPQIIGSSGFKVQTNSAIRTYAIPQSPEKPTQLPYNLKKPVEPTSRDLYIKSLFAEKHRVQLQYDEAKRLLAQVQLKKTALLNKKLKLNVPNPAAVTVPDQIIQTRNNVLAQVETLDTAPRQRPKSYTIKNLDAATLTRFTPANQKFINGNSSGWQGNPKPSVTVSTKPQTSPLTSNVEPIILNQAEIDKAKRLKNNVEAAQIKAKAELAEIDVKVEIATNKINGLAPELETFEKNIDELMKKIKIEITEENFRLKSFRDEMIRYTQLDADLSNQRLTELADYQIKRLKIITAQNEVERKVAYDRAEAQRVRYTQATVSYENNKLVLTEKRATLVKKVLDDDVYSIILRRGMPPALTAQYLNITDNLSTTVLNPISNVYKNIVGKVKNNIVTTTVLENYKKFKPTVMKLTKSVKPPISKMLKIGGPLLEIAGIGLTAYQMGAFSGSERLDDDYTDPFGEIASMFIEGVAAGIKQIDPNAGV